MNTQKINELGGKVTFDDISHLNQATEPLLLIDDLKEDLFQACFPLDQILDIGWYPEFCKDGHFRVVLISESNWDTPIHCENAKNWAELEEVLTNALNKIKK
ncbi:hypothetical protein [Pseudomonas sp. T1.Ur]|uniref:hypothetical protein n=1 Tax=Pseudomonas sp. T1.Ur TaxID=2928704 RepID=UPI00201E5585|nr:hypothetical protein [Pseudomonas sp. T1.Ur]MCL6703261.1 hypothetical protein [Pseudomonas sp. T1.Ur]